MSVNKGAFKALGSPSGIVFFYDAAARVIGLKGATEGTSHAAPLRKQGGSESYIVSANSFLNAYQIQHERLTVFEEAEVEDGILILELSKARVEQGPTRIRKPAAG